MKKMDKIKDMINTLKKAIESFNADANVDVLLDEIKDIINSLKEVRLTIVKTAVLSSAYSDYLRRLYDLKKADLNIKSL